MPYTIWGQPAWSSFFLFFLVEALDAPLDIGSYRYMIMNISLGTLVVIEILDLVKQHNNSSSLKNGTPVFKRKYRRTIHEQFQSWVTWKNNDSGPIRNSKNDSLWCALILSLDENSFIFSQWQRQMPYVSGIW